MDELAPAQRRRHHHDHNLDERSRRTNKLILTVRIPAAVDSRVSSTVRRHVVEITARERSLIVTGTPRE